MLEKYHDAILSKKSLRVRSDCLFLKLAPFSKERKKEREEDISLLKYQVSAVPWAQRIQIRELRSEDYISPNS